MKGAMRFILIASAVTFVVGLAACVPDEAASPPPELDETSAEPDATEVTPGSAQEDDVNETPDAPTDVPDTPGDETPEDGPPSPTSDGPHATTVDAVTEAAVKFLAEQLDVAPETVMVDSVEAVEWPSGALGCPQPGQMYTQAIVPGYRLVLSVEGDTYAVHTDRRLPDPVMIMCDSGAPLEKNPTQ